MANELNQGKGQEGLGAENRLKAWKLYLAGKSYREIGRELNLSHGRIFQFVKETLDVLEKERLEIGMKYVGTEIERLDKMLKILEPKMVDGDIAALQMVVKIQERRAKYLALDSPAKVEHSGSICLEDLVCGGKEDKK